MLAAVLADHLMVRRLDQIGAIRRYAGAAAVRTLHEERRYASETRVLDRLFFLVPVPARQRGDARGMSVYHARASLSFSFCR